MRITASAISLNVDDVTASAEFMKQHFGFNEAMAADGFVSLTREDFVMGDTSYVLVVLPALLTAIDGGTPEPFEIRTIDA